MCCAFLKHVDIYFICISMSQQSVWVWFVLIFGFAFLLHSLSLSRSRCSSHLSTFFNQANGNKIEPLLLPCYMLRCCVTANTLYAHAHMHRHTHTWESHTHSRWSRSSGFWESEKSKGIVYADGLKTWECMYMRVSNGNAFVSRRPNSRVCFYFQSISLHSPLNGFPQSLTFPRFNGFFFLFLLLPSYILLLPPLLLYLVIE